MKREKLFKPVPECIDFFASLVECKTMTGMEKLLLETDYKTLNTVVLLYSIGRRYRGQRRKQVFLHPERVLATEAEYIGLSGPNGQEDDVLYLTGKGDLHSCIERGLMMCGALNEARCLRL